MKTWNKYCPLMKGKCVNGFVKGMPEKEDGTRESCAFFIELAGKNPQTGESVSDPGCSVAFLPVILLEGNLFMRQAVASTDKVATEVQKHHETFSLALHTRKRLMDAAPQPKPLSNGGEEKP